MKEPRNTSVINIGESIKVGLQLCKELLNKGKCAEKEYNLFMSLGELYLLKGDVREYPKIVAIYHVKAITELRNIKESWGSIGII